MADATSPGEVAGIISAIVVGLVAIGKGAQWLIGFFAGRHAATEQGREAKLQKWHDELERREAAFDARLEHEFSEMKAENRQREKEGLALRMAFELVASALRAMDPRNTALSRAEQLLQAAFPLMPHVPPDMTADLKTIDRKDHAATAAARTMGDNT